MKKKKNASRRKKEFCGMIEIICSYPINVSFAKWKTSSL